MLLIETARSSCPLCFASLPLFDVLVIVVVANIWAIVSVALTVGNFGITLQYISEKGESWIRRRFLFLTRSFPNRRVSPLAVRTYQEAAQRRVSETFANAYVISWVKEDLNLRRGIAHIGDIGISALEPERRTCRRRRRGI